jgi:DNA-binding FadR family transcriptional regulator
LELLRYLLDTTRGLEPEQRLPTLGDLSEELDVSLPRLREQLAVARSLGLVSVRPRVGIHRKEYQFTPAVWQSLLFAIQEDHRHFLDFLDLRRHIELAYFTQAVNSLREEDRQCLLRLVAEAHRKLDGRPVRIPNEEHQQFHLLIYKRLDNIFVTGILEAYWKAYDAEGLNVYADISYLKRIWKYHQELAEAIHRGDVDASIVLLREHFDLLMERLRSG